MRRHLPLLLVAGFLAGLALVLALAPGADEPMDALDDVTETLAAAAAAALGLRTARRHVGRQRRMWAGFGLFALCWAVGQMLWTFLEVVHGSDVPTPWYSDAWFLAALLPGVIGATAMQPPSLSALSRARSLVDGLLAGVVLLLFFWPILLEHVFEADGLDPTGKATLLGPMLGDAIMLTIAAAATVRIVRRGRGPHVAVVLGVGSILVADGWYAFKTTVGGFATGPVDVFWTAGFAAIAIAALVASRRDGSSVVGLDDPSRAPSGVLLPAVATCVAAGVAIWQYVTTNESDAPVVALLVSAIMLVSVSQAIASIDVQQLAARLAELSTRDPLTGLFNRTGLAQAVGRQLRRSRAVNFCSVLFIDLDGFKSVNDVHGHGAGDQVLQVVAQRVATAVRPGDTLARLGGDELVAFLPGLCRADAAVVARRVLDRVRMPISTDAGMVNVGASIGVSDLGPGDDVAAHLDQLIAAADSAMYQAKSRGKNQVIAEAPVPSP